MWRARRARVVDIPEDEVDTVSAGVDQRGPSFLTEEQEQDSLYQFGSEKNARELEEKMSKLILAVEMDNWEKAEMFMEVIRQLTENAPREVKSATLRLKMAVQKGDYEKTINAHQALSEIL